MSRRRFTLAFCPIGKFVFSHEGRDAAEAGCCAQIERLGIDYVDLETVLPDGMVRDQKHVEPVVEHFRDQRIDALFIPHCNFGTEGAAARSPGSSACRRCCGGRGMRPRCPTAPGFAIRFAACWRPARCWSSWACRSPTSRTAASTIRQFAEGLDAFVRPPTWPTRFAGAAGSA